MTQPTAALIIIGNEILSGRTIDANLNTVARFFKSHGIRLREVRVIGDEEEKIIKAVNELRAQNTYVLTTGGIGATHDDITAQCIAKALGRNFCEHAQAVKILEEYYENRYKAFEDPTLRFNSVRRRMALMPEGSQLISNGVSGAPGFYIENVYVLAGVPKIVESMLEALREIIPMAPAILSRTLRSDIVENLIADELAAIQKESPDVEIGSYPFFENNMYGTHLVISSLDAKAVDEALLKVLEMLKEKGGSPKLCD